MQANNTRSILTARTRWLSRLARTSRGDRAAILAARAELAARYSYRARLAFLASKLLGIAAIAVVLGAAGTANAARCVFITEGDGTLVAACGKAGGR